MKILVVFTGGTIGSTKKNGCVSTDRTKGYRLLELYREREGHYVDDVVFETASPYSELSENLDCPLLEQLIFFLGESCQDDSYDGVIITHGTDTLQYSAAALAYCFGDTQVPMVLVSSNYVLEDERANGISNFAGAVSLIRQGGSKGVFVSYQNRGECTKIYWADTLLEHIAYSDRMESVQGICFGEFGENGFEVNRKIRRKKMDFALCKRFRRAVVEHVRRRDEKSVEESFEELFSGVLWIRPYAGMYYPAVPHGVRAVLHGSYHSGTICSKSHDLADFMRETSRRKIPVFVCGDGDSAGYESKQVYEEFGFYVLPVASPVAMYIKLWLCVRCGANENEMVRWMMAGV